MDIFVFLFAGAAIIAAIAGVTVVTGCAIVQFV